MVRRSRNASDIPAQALLLAAGVLITVLIISILFMQFKSASNLGNAVTDQISDTTEDIKNNDILQYDGMTVSGADVVNFYKKHLGDYTSGQTGPFTIVIGGTSYSNGASVSLLRDSSSGAYVKPTAKYKCSVTRNANGMITKVTFTKQ